MKFIEYSNATLGGPRLVETAEGKREVRDIRMLGCPDEIATRIERRNAKRAGTVASSDADELKSKIDALEAL